MWEKSGKSQGILKTDVCGNHDYLVISLLGSRRALQALLTVMPYWWIYSSLWFALSGKRAGNTSSEAGRYNLS